MAAIRRSFKARYSSKETKMPRNHTTQPRSDYASSFLHRTATSPPRENCDQKALHSKAPLQSVAQLHTAAHHRGKKIVIKRHYTAKPRCSLLYKP
ncbi:hypothetical protein ACFX16_025542 [Malus domestica]